MPKWKRMDEDPEAADARAATASGLPARSPITAHDSLLALQQSAGNQAVTRMMQGPGGLLMKDDPKELERVGPGMLLGDADAAEQTPGVAAPEADAALGPGAVATAPPAAAGPASAGPAAPSAAGPVAADPAAPAAPGPAPAPAAGDGGAAAAPPLVLNHRTDMRAPDGTPNTRTTVAMGEVVYFDVGGLDATWTASAGWPPRRTARPAFAWELPEPGTATITATLADGRTASVDMTVVAPDSLRMRKESEDSEAAGTAGAGMWLIPRFGPSSVNFGNVEWLEEPRGASGATGFFKDQIDAGIDLDHHPNPDFLRIGPGLRDHAAYLGLGTSGWSDGYFFWTIPNSFRRAGTAGPGQMYVTGSQHFRIKADGTVTVSKQGASVTRAP
jgi:hypothetical protein